MQEDALPGGGRRRLGPIEALQIWFVLLIFPIVVGGRLQKFVIRRVESIWSLTRSMMLSKPS